MDILSARANILSKKPAHKIGSKLFATKVGVINFYITYSLVSNVALVYITCQRRVNIATFDY